VLKRSGSKSLMIDGERFRYIVSEGGREADGRVALCVIVQHVHGNGARLQVMGLFGERVPEEESRFYLGRTLKRPIRPRCRACGVGACIEGCRSSGGSLAAGSWCQRTAF